MKKQLKSKTKTTKKQSFLSKVISNKAVRILAVLAVLLGTGYYLVKDQLLQKSEIYVAETANITLATCGVANFQVDSPCSEDGKFNNVTYTCADGKGVEGTKSACRTLDEWHKYAQEACANKCISIAIPPQPSPSTVCGKCSGDTAMMQCDKNQTKVVTTDSCGCEKVSCATGTTTDDTNIKPVASPGCMIQEMCTKSYPPKCNYKQVCPTTTCAVCPNPDPNFVCKKGAVKIAKDECGCEKYSCPSEAIGR